jgi:threonine/homoserine/homoserine lactone efflux protein
VDLGSLTALDAACVAGIILPTVYAVIAAYAWLAARGRDLARAGRLWKVVRRGAGAVMIGAGAAVAAK